MTSYFQDGGRRTDVCPPLTAAYLAVSAGCPLACRAHDTYSYIFAYSMASVFIFKEIF